MFELTLIAHVMSRLRSQLRELHSAQGGYTNETIAITAALVGLALVVTGIIASKVIATANGIQTR